MAGCVIGLGIATMHHTGMDAMKVGGTLQWDVPLAIMSVVLGVLLSLGACWVFARRQSIVMAAALLMAAICLLHFTAMGAATLTYDPTVSERGLAMDNTLLAAAVAAVTVLALLSGLNAALSNAELARESRERIQRLRHMADHDDLTGLPNRSFISRFIRETVEAYQSPGEGFLLLFVDLDNFKQVNDTYGHIAGDHVLREAAHRIRSVVGDAIVARNGGDEFLIVQTSGSPASLQVIADRVLSVFEEPIHLSSGETARIGVSIGVASYPEDGATVDCILKAADAALYKVKHAGGGAMAVA
jgi:diguanylate cyclase (GGDEF)-like protein